MVLVPQAHGEGKRPLSHGGRQAAVVSTMVVVPKNHTVKASGRCLHHGFGAKHTGKASGRCLYHGFGTIPKTHGEDKLVVSVPKTHGEGKRPLPSHGFGAKGHAVKASGRCLHHGFGDKTTL